MNWDIVAGLAASFVVGVGLGHAFGKDNGRKAERNRVVEWLRAAGGPLDNYPAKLAELIAMGAHLKPNDTMKREG